MKDMIVIPDIHGRDFWKEAVNGHEDEEIIFLGDYVDPYCYFEDVNPWDGLKSLREVIDFKKQHPGNVTLLLGNHDLSYVSDYLAKCRHDYDNDEVIHHVILDNLSLFSIAHQKLIAGRRYIFTHAGIIPYWLLSDELLSETVTAGHEVETLNNLFRSGRLYPSLGCISATRGGDQLFGSCVWADVSEHLVCESFPDLSLGAEVYQVFGHTLQTSGKPIITPHFACLDCRKAFTIDPEGQITEFPLPH